MEATHNAKNTTRKCNNKDSGVNIIILSLSLTPLNIILICQNINSFLSNMLFSNSLKRFSDVYRGLGKRYVVLRRNTLKCCLGYVSWINPFSRQCPISIPPENVMVYRNRTLAWKGLKGYIEISEHSKNNVKVF